MPTSRAATDPGHRRLTDTLVRHGLAEGRAQAVVALGQVLRAQMLREPDPDRQREHGGLLDARTGEQIGDIAVGTRAGLTFAEQIAVARERAITSIVGVHTHPGSSSFSDAD